MGSLCWLGGRIFEQQRKQRMVWQFIQQWILAGEFIELQQRCSSMLRTCIQQLQQWSGGILCARIG
jgi:hypothetical protein